MRDVESIVNDVAKIYQESGHEAEEYLRKARRLREKFGPGLAIVYCWFYSLPQKWIQVEPKIFELMRLTNSFDLDKISMMSREDLAMILRPMIFYNVISSQLKNFCRAVKEEYLSWDSFAKALRQESIFETFEKLREHRNIRVTFKNLAAMMIFVGMDDDLLILDTHVAKVLGLNEYEIRKYRTREKLFESLLRGCKQITYKLRRHGFDKMCIAKWSLAVWFDKAGIRANDLLRFT